MSAAEEPASPDEPSGPLIDAAVFLSVYEAFQPHRRRDILEAVTSDLSLYGHEIVNASRSDDAQRMSKACHALRGAAANVGASDIIALLNALRDQGFPPSSATIDRLWMGVEATIDGLGRLAAQSDAAPD